MAEETAKNPLLDMITATSQLQMDAAAVRAEKPNWRSYLQSQMITQNDFNVIVAYEESDAEKKASIYRTDGHAVLVAQTVLNLMSNVSKVQTVRYMLTLIDDAIHEDNSRVRMFWLYARQNRQSVWAPFLAMLTRDDAFVVNQTSRVICKLATMGSNPRMAGADLVNYLDFLKQQLRLSSNSYVQTSARCLQMLLREDSYRLAFAKGDGISVLVSILSGKSNFQLQYQLTFCLWCLSYNAEVAGRMQRHGVIPTLADILSDTSKEKVQRIILATFRNILDNVEDGQRDNALTMVQCKVLKTLELMGARKFEDDELNDDIAYIAEKLQSNVQDLSSFDEYCTEIRSGRLIWSPVHKSDKFWHENAQRFNEKAFEMVKLLVTILDTSSDPLVLAVAAHDVGEYVRHYPRGKTVLEQLHGKTQVMKLLTHADPNVRYHALLAVQKLMVHNWEYLGKQIEEPSSNEKNPMNMKIPTKG